VTIKHILVPTDFSEYADYALDYAIEIAKAFTARLTFLHVIHLTPLAMGDIGVSGLVPYLEEIETDAQQRMQTLLNRVHQEGLRRDGYRPRCTFSSHCRYG